MKERVILYNINGSWCNVNMRIKWIGFIKIHISNKQRILWKAGAIFQHMNLIINFISGIDGIAHFWREGGNGGNICE
jgi:hypothetical protein